MKQSLSEKGRPFRLVKYVTSASLVLLLMGTLVMSLIVMHWAKMILITKSEDYALLVADNLNHQIFLQFIIPVAVEMGSFQLSHKAQFDRMDRVVRGSLHGFNVKMVNLFDMNNTIVYSFNPSIIGKRNRGGVGYQKALKGKTTSSFLQNRYFWDIFFEIPRDSQMITYKPLRSERSIHTGSSNILGVIEITQDLTKDYRSIFNLQLLIVVTSICVLGAAFLILIYVVNHGEKILKDRADERRKLEEQLMRSERFASLGKMAAGVSHEIRNPLGIIRSSAQLLIKKIKHNSDSNLLNVIIEEANRLNDIVTDFLQLSLHRPTSLVPCGIKDIIEKNILFLTPQLQNSPYEIVSKYQSDLPQIKADPNLLYQAFLNILINSMQAMPNGGLISIAVSSDNINIYIIIDDEGDGISDSLLDKIWDPFFTTKEKGTGLGLSIVKNIIEVHHGDISIENGPRCGAQIRISLPIKT